jgi:predicted nucleic acid-binding protein
MIPIALDTNILVKAMREEDAPADALRALIARRAAEGTRFAVPVFCVGELWRIVTDRRATIRIAPQRALAWIDRLVTEGVMLLTPGPGYWAALKKLLAHGQPEGLGVFDCQVAATCQEHGIEEIWTFDRAFVPHAQLRVIDPLDLSDAG